MVFGTNHRMHDGTKKFFVMLTSEPCTIVIILDEPLNTNWKLPEKTKRLHTVMNMVSSTYTNVTFRMAFIVAIYINAN